MFAVANQYLNMQTVVVDGGYVLAAGSVWVGYESRLLSSAIQEILPRFSVVSMVNWD